MIIRWKEPGTGSRRGFCLWVPNVVSCNSLYLPACLPNFEDSILPCGHNSLTDLRRLVDFFKAYSAFYCQHRVITSKLLIYRIRNWKPLFNSLWLKKKMGTFWLIYRKKIIRKKIYWNSWDSSQNCMKTYAGKLWEVQNLEKLHDCKPTSGHHPQGEQSYQGSVGEVLPKRKFGVLLEERGAALKHLCPGKEEAKQLLKFWLSLLEFLSSVRILCSLRIFSYQGLNLYMEII